MKKAFLMITMFMAVVSAFAGIVNLSSYASFSAAVTAIGTTRTTLVLDVPATVPAGGLTIPRTLQLKTAMELISLNGNLAVNGPFEAGIHQVFTGAGTVTFSRETVREIYPEWWGAIGDGSTDCTDAINKAIQATLTNTNAPVNIKAGAAYETGGGTLKFSPGVYNVTSVNLSDSLNNAPTHSIKIIGSGSLATFIQGTQNGAIVIDGLGRSNVTMTDLTITTLSGVTAQTGLLLARRQSGAYMSNANTFNRVNVEGSFSVACVAWIAAEVNKWDTGTLSNTCSTNNYCSFFTSPNNTIANITSTNGSIDNDTGMDTNTVNTMSNVCFQAYSNNATPVILHQWAAYTFIGCLVGSTGTGNKLVTYINDASDGCATFRGPVRWIATDWETGGGTVHYFKKSGNISEMRFKDILDEGAELAFLTAGNQYIINTDGTPSTLNNVVIRSTGLALGNSTLYISVNNIYNCHFNICDYFAAAQPIFNVSGTSKISSLGEGYSKGTGSPFNAVAPEFPGQEYLDTATNVWWKASLAAGNYWYPMSSLYRTGTVTPVNNVTPAFVGDEYLNTSTNVWWKAYSVTSPYWYPLY